MISTLLIHRASTDAYSTGRQKPDIVEQRIRHEAIAIRMCVVKQSAIAPESKDHWPCSVDVVAFVDGIHITQHANFRQVPAMRDTISIPPKKEIKVKQKNGAQ